MKQLNIKNILVPIDFSAMSIQAIETAKNLARRFNATVHLAHVHEFWYPAGFGGIADGAPAIMPDWPIDLAQQARKAVTRRLDEIARRHGVSPANCHILEGAPPFDQICRFARELDVDLIVTPTRGRTGVKGLFLGSTSERVVQHSPCPVLVDRKSPSRIDKILVPVDFSDCSLEALKFAVAFAGKTAAGIIVLHSIHLDLAFTAEGYATYDITTLIDAARKNAEKEIRSFVRKAKAGGVPLETTVQVGPPVTIISRVAESKDVDLIVTATHGRTGLKHLLMGSVAEQIVRYTKRPVLVVPSHPAVRIKRISAQKRSLRRLKAPRRTTKRMPIEPGHFTKRFRKITANRFPERRLTNKFRQVHRVGNG